MRTISLHRLLIRLTAIAIATAPVAAGAALSRAAATASPLTAALYARGSDDLLDPTLAIDRDHLEARDAVLVLGRSLAAALATIPPIEATQLATGWATADDPVRRGAVASALEWIFPLVGDDVILDHLSRDADPVIRLACARAAWIRRPTGGDAGVLARLAHDPDPEVRAVATLAG